MRIHFIWCNYINFNSVVFYGSPHGLFLLSVPLVKMGHEVDISMYTGKRDSLRRIQERIKKNKYDVVAISSNSVEKPLALDLLKKISGKFLKIAGGLGPSFEPEEFLKYCDYVFIGEGEDTLVKFLHAVQNKKSINIKGVYSKKDNGPYLPAPMIDLEKYSVPDFWFMPDKEDVPKKLYCNSTGLYIGSRGCPSACYFCYNSTVKKDFFNFFRMKSADKVCGELKMMKKVNPAIKSWNILEDTFLARPPKDLRKIADTICSMNTTFSCNARIEDITDEKIGLMFYGGLRGIAIGLERATEELRNYANKPKFTNEKLFQVLKILKKYELKITVFNMCGFPDETRGTIMKLLRLNLLIKNYLKDSKLEIISWMSPLRVLPRSKWYDEYRGDIKPNFIGGRDQLTPNINVRGISENELKNWRKWWVLYINFISEIPDLKVQEKIINDLAKNGPQMDQNRTKLFKALKRKYNIRFKKLVPTE